MMPSKEELQQFYPKLNLNELARKYHVHYLDIRKWLLDYNVKIRKKGSHTLIKKSIKPIKPRRRCIISSEELRRFYIDEKLSMFSIGQKLGFASSTIHRKLREFKIPIRKPSEGKKINIPKEKIKELYDEGLTIEKIAKKLGYSYTVIRMRMNDYKIKRRTGGTVYVPKLIFNPLMAYIFGVLDGDGSISKFGFISLEVKDQPFATSFFNSLKNLGLNPTIKIRRDHNRWIVYAYSSILATYYHSLDIEKKFKLIDDSNVFIDYLRGFYESEGSYKKYNGQYRITISNGYLERVNMVKNRIENLGFNPKISKGAYFVRNQKRMMYNIGLYRQNEIPRFLKLVNPHIRGL